MPRADRPIIDGLPRGAKKTDEVIKHLEAVEAGTPIPYFRDSDGRLKYFDFKETNSETGEKRYSLIDLSSKLEREAARTAEQLGLTPTLEMYVNQFGPETGQAVFLEEQLKMKNEFDNYDTDLYDMDHMGSKRFKYPHLARDVNPQLKSHNRGEGARQLTPDQETAFRVVPGDLETTIALQGPELTRQQKDRVMGRVNGGSTGKYIGRLQAGASGAIELTLEMLEAAAEMQAGPGGAEAMYKTSNGTYQKNGQMADIARKNGGLNGMPDFGITEQVFGKSLVQDERNGL